ncbi:MAG TPA: co-chaperone YbbN [Usitatibacter sp.]|nr:co-chaperone YbbN [Usitatibacter sp.]
MHRIDMIDTTLSTFESDVIEASMEVPVLVDFWAPWCGPCKTLGPLLERLEREYGGRFKLVNVNSDTNPELVASFNLKSIPYAVAFVDGNAVAQFMGAQPEAYLRAFLDRLIPNPADLEHRCAREAILEGRIAIAEEALGNALALDPSCDGARLDMVALLLDRGDVDAARRHFALLGERAVNQSTYHTVRARMEAVEAASKLPPVELLEQRIEEDDADLQSRLDLADLHVARRNYPAALEQLLEIVRRDRTFGEDIGRIRMLEVFEMAADQSDLVGAYRNHLSQVLF